MLVEFRKDFPTVEFFEVISHFRGEKKLSFPRLVSNIFEVISYGLGQVLPENKQVAPLVFGAEPLSTTNVLDYLEAQTKPAVEGVKTVIPWAFVVPILIRLLEEVAKKYLFSEETV